MIDRIKTFLRRRWPRLRLRLILFAVLFFAAAMPGISAIFLRVYENTLVRQTEAELVAQGAALAAMAAVSWPDAPPPDPNPDRLAARLLRARTHDPGPAHRRRPARTPGVQPQRQGGGPGRHQRRPDA
ncbi:hypothetical protein ACRAWD_02705 [Caulobacter segnis]